MDSDDTVRTIGETIGKGSTLIQFKVCDSLPFIRGDEPFVVLLSTRKINDKLILVVAESVQDGLQTIHGKFGVWEKVGCDDYLLHC